MTSSPPRPRPRCGWCGCPAGAVTTAAQADALYEELSRRGVEAAPVCFGRAGYLRIAAAPYNTADDYDWLAGHPHGPAGREVTVAGWDGEVRPARDATAGSAPARP